MRFRWYHVLSMLLCAHAGSLPVRAEQWEWVAPRPIGTELRDCKVALDNSVWVVAHGGEVLRSTDSGVSFQRLPHGTFSDLESVAAFDHQTAVVVGSRGYVAVTSNGGTTWTQLGLPDGDTAVSACYSRNGDLWIGCVASAVLQSTNHGVNWTRHALEGTDSIRLIESREDYVVCCALERVWYSSITDPTWKRKTIPSAYRIHAIAMDGAGSTWIASYAGTIRMNLSTGQLTLVPTTRFYRLAASAGGTIIGAVENDRRMYRSTDYGVSWTDIAWDGSYANQIVNLYADTFLKLAIQGVFSRSADKGATWTPYSGVWGFSFVFVTSDSVIYTTERYQNNGVWRSSDAGATWTFKPFGRPITLRYMQFLTNTIGFMGDENVAYITTDGAETWDTIAVLRNAIRMSRVAGTDTIYALGSIGGINPPVRSRLIRSVNGGRTFDTVHEYSSHTNSMAFLPNGVGYISLSLCRLEATTDHGRTWEQRNAAEACIPNIWAVDDLRVFGTSEGLRFVRSMDGGRTWALAIDADIRGMAWHGPQVLCAFEKNHRYHISTDGGITWTADSTSIPVLQFAHFDSKGRLYLAGEAGIVRVERDGIVNVEEFDHPQTNTPTSHEFTIGDHITVYDITGEQWTSSTFDNIQATFESLPRGVWIVVARSSTPPFIKRRLAYKN